MTRKTKNLSRDELNAAVLAALPDLLLEWLPGGEFRDGKYVALNPNRDDDSLGSFQIDLETGARNDYAIDERGSYAIALHAYLFNHGDYKASWRELTRCEHVVGAAAGVQLAPRAKEANRLKNSDEKRARAKRLYEAAAGLANQPAHAYLTSRGLRPTAAWDRLRASSAPYPGKGLCPVLIAPIEAPDGTMVGVHRTYLQPSSKKLAVPNPRRTLGQVKGNAVHLGVTEDELIVCEGLEDGLTLNQELGLPVWVACGASFLPSLSIPEQVRSIIIAAENDPAGEAAAYRAAEAMAVLGRKVRIMWPSPAFKDFNDELCGVRHD